MTTKQPIFQRLPLLLTTALLATGLLISGCSDNESTDTESTDNAQDTAAVVDQSKEDTADLSDTDTASDAEPAVVGAEDSSAMASDAISPATTASKQSSLVTNPTQAGTPEDTVKQAVNSLYNGDIKKAVGYYQVDMPNFEEELANTQSAFQQTVDAITLTNTTYNDDKTRATITGELMLKGQSKPAPLTYELQKIAGKWKILG